MAVMSAKSATLSYGAGPTLQADVRNVQWTETNDVNVYASSSTAGLKKRVAGHSDLSGSFEVYSDAVAAGLQEGETIALTVKPDGTTAHPSMSATSCVIESIAYNVPIEGGGLISAVVNFGRA